MKNTFLNQLLTKGGTEIISSEINEVIPQIITIPNNNKYIYGGFCVIAAVSCLIQSIDCIIKKDFKGIPRLMLAHIIILVVAMGVSSIMGPIGGGIKPNW